jgi:hypothetical protein
MLHHNQSKPHAFNDRLEEQKKLLEAEAARAGPGPARNALARRLRQLDVAAHINEWLSSPGLQAPR